MSARQLDASQRQRDLQALSTRLKADTGDHAAAAHIGDLDRFFVEVEMPAGKLNHVRFGPNHSLAFVIKHSLFLSLYYLRCQSTCETRH
jgi:hypothetical protein